MSANELERVVVTGAQGQLGRSLLQVAEERGFQVIALSRSDLDITSRTNVMNAVRDISPSHVINAAAYTAVDNAETDSVRAHAINRDGPDHLAQAAATIGCRLLHVSTDFVFDGRQAAPYQPDDPANPLSVYGASKLAGERAISERLGRDAFVLRTAWVYSSVGNNFFTTMLRLMRERDELQVVDDQIGTPTHAGGLAAALWCAVEKNLGGTHHWTDLGVASWYDFAVAIAEEAVSTGHLAKMPSVKPVRSEMFKRPATRPSSSVLDKHATLNAMGCKSLHWRQALCAVFQQLQNDHIDCSVSSN